MPKKKLVIVGLLALMTLYGGYKVCNQLKSKNPEKYRNKMEKQIEKAKSLDALLVLGGEGESYSRSNHASKLYKASRETRKSPLKIVLTGYCNGLSLKAPEKAESEVMKEYLISCDIPAEVIYNETKSLDTLANVIYAQPILKEIDAEKIGLVTDKFHMPRGMWSAKRVLGKSYEIYPCSNEKQTSLVGYLIEVAIKNAQKIDLFIAGIKAGDQKAFEKYLKEKHPFHAPKHGNKVPLGAYKLGISLYKLLRGK